MEPIVVHDLVDQIISGLQSLAEDRKLDLTRWREATDTIIPGSNLGSKLSKSYEAIIKASASNLPRYRRGERPLTLERLGRLYVLLSRLGFCPRLEESKDQKLLKVDEHTYDEPLRNEIIALLPDALNRIQRNDPLPLDANPETQVGDTSLVVEAEAKSDTRDASPKAGPSAELPRWPRKIEWWSIFPTIGWITATVIGAVVLFVSIGLLYDWKINPYICRNWPSYCKASAAERICDLEATATWDPDRRPAITGVEFESMDGRAAVAACEIAVKANPSNRRLAFQLGRAHLRAMDYKAAKTAFEKAAAMGSSSAVVNLGQLYTNAQGVPKNLTQAANFYRQAAEAQNAEGMYWYANALANGLGVPVDKAAADYWYRRALSVDLTPERARQARAALQALQQK